LKRHGIQSVLCFKPLTGIAIIQGILNNSHPTNIIRYIGIAGEETNNGGLITFGRSTENNIGKAKGNHYFDNKERRH
jgi:hypothetical protein